VDGPRHRVPDHQRGPGQRVPPVQRPDRAAPAARRARASGGTAGSRRATRCRCSTTPPGQARVHAPTRELAIDRMLRALGELRVVGVETSAPFHRRVLLEPDFRAGRIDIRYIEEHPGAPGAGRAGEHAPVPGRGERRCWRRRSVSAGRCAARIGRTRRRRPAGATWAGADPTGARAVSGSSGLPFAAVVSNMDDIRPLARSPSGAAPGRNAEVNPSDKSPSGDSASSSGTTGSWTRTRGCPWARRLTTWLASRSRYVNLTTLTG
jgi:hypothetical protein